ncbi:hypothetical protein [Aquimarina sediminis]|uniref:hypothetical protein n=1 Tax=Aquimarina sediminis TaxID=2070536 RepID=UPI000CA075B1|nr:hypothetical protein [Aquimarina sediminis]
MEKEFKIFAVKFNPKSSGEENYSFKLSAKDISESYIKARELLKNSYQIDSSLYHINSTEI